MNEPESPAILHAEMSKITDFFDSRIVRMVCFQVVLAAVAAIFFAHAIHFPRAAERPPAPYTLIKTLWFAVSSAIGLIGLWAALPSDARYLRICVGTLIVWFLWSYAIAFLWINTYGT